MAHAYRSTTALAASFGCALAAWFAVVPPAGAARNGVIAATLTSGGCAASAGDTPAATTADDDCTTTSFGIATVRPDGRGWRRLPLPRGARWGDFSGDGAFLAFSTWTATFVSTAAGGSVTRVAGETYGYDWSPRGRTLVAAQPVRSAPRTYELVRLAAPAWRPRRLTVGRAPHWSPSARRIAYLRGSDDGDRRNPLRIMVVASDGRGARSLRTFPPDATPSVSLEGWSTNGRSVMYSASGDRYAIDLATRRQRRVAEPARAPGVVSPDGRLRAYGGTRIHIAPRSGGTARLLPGSPARWEADAFEVSDWQPLP